MRRTFIAAGAAWPRLTLAGTVVLGAILPACTSAEHGGSDAPTSPSRPAQPVERVTGPRSYLFVTPVTGGTPRRLLSAAQAARLVSVSDPVWSPDGRQIAFTGGCPTCTPRLYLVSASGQDLRQVPTGPGAVHSPGWSPRGNAIVFARQFGEQQFIVAVDLKTHRVRVINNEPASTDNSDWTPSWSPDGRRIVFARELHHEDVTLWLVPAAGGRPQPLISHEHAFDQSHPQWSPDGRDVVFMQAVSPSVTWDLYVLSTATGKLRRLTHDARNEYDPAWAPNGTRVVFASDVASRAGFRSLYVIDVTGAGLRRLTASQADDSMPSWSPDGREIVFVRRPTSRA